MAIGTPDKLIKVLKNLYEKSEMAVKTKGRLSRWVRATLDSRQ
jgi:hypothetical protein